jgi:ribonuclease HI
MKNFKIYTDGAARGNPGPAGCAAVIIDEKTNSKHFFNKFIGKSTNNFAEYQGLILGLKAAEKIGAEEIKVFLDSELVVKQIKGEYRVKELNLKKLHQQAFKLLSTFKKFSIQHIPREKNKEADKLANEAIDSNY